MRRDSPSSTADDSSESGWIVVPAVKTGVTAARSEPLLPRRRRATAKTHGYAVPEALLAHAGSIRDAISLPGAVPAVSVKDATVSRHAVAEPPSSRNHNSTSAPSAYAQTAAATPECPPPPLQRIATSSALSKDSSIVKYFCMFCTEAGPVPGVLTLTTQALMFEADPRSAAVIDRGCGQFQLYIDLIDLVACASVMLPDAPLLTCFFGFRHSASLDNKDHAHLPCFFQVVVDSVHNRKRRRAGNFYLPPHLVKTTKTSRPPHPPNKNRSETVPTEELIVTDSTAAAAAEPSRTPAFPHVDFRTSRTGLTDPIPGPLDQETVSIPASDPMNSTPIGECSVPDFVLPPAADRSPNSSSRTHRILGTLGSWRRRPGRPFNGEEDNWLARAFSTTSARTPTSMDSRKQERLLFRFGDAEDVRELTTRSMEYMDQRDSKLASELGSWATGSPRERMRSSSGAFSHQGTFHSSGVSFVATNSGRVLDAFMLSPRTQHTVLFFAKQLDAEEGESAPAAAQQLFARVLSVLASDPSGAAATAAAAAAAAAAKPIEPAIETPETTAYAKESSGTPLWSVYITPVPSGAPQLVTAHVAQELALSMAPSIAAKNWTLLFCSTVHGVSYLTFYRRLKDVGPCLLIIEDLDGAVFGAFLSEAPIEKSHYYGSGETFVFTFWDGDFQSKADKTPAAKAEGKPGRVYTWTSKNNFLIYTDSRSIAIGGGGSYALTVDAAFLCGSSAPCATFGNPMLSAKWDFTVRYLQVWGFTDT